MDELRLTNEEISILNFKESLEHDEEARKVYEIEMSKPIKKIWA